MDYCHQFEQRKRDGEQKQHRGNDPLSALKQLLDGTPDRDRILEEEQARHVHGRNIQIRTIRCG